jgi:RNA polymerase sigma-70 factor (ECF subfamily)
MRIANNSVRRYLRNRRFQFWRQVQQSAVEAAQVGNWLPDRKISPEARTVINQQVQAVWEATKDLSVRQRTIFLLRFMEEMSVLEIAEATGLSESTVNVHLFRAVRAVRRRLGENHE